MAAGRGGRPWLSAVAVGPGVQTRTMDPTGLSSPFGQLVIGAGLLATIVVGIVALRRRR